MSWLSGPCIGGPTRAESARDAALAGWIADLADTAFEAGRAAQRGDADEANRLNRRAIVLAGLIRTATGTRNGTEPDLVHMQ